MGIFKKLGDLARSQINAFLDQVEDTQKLKEQAIIDLEESRKKARKLLASAQAAIKLAEQQKLHHLDKIEQLDQNALTSLKQKDEAQAKKILLEKQHLIDEQEILIDRIEKEKQTIETLHHGLHAIDEKISTLKSKASLSSSQEQLDKEDVFNTFDRMEEKIEQAEREVEALNEIIDLNEKAPDKKSETSFDKYSDPTLLEKELEALKNKLKE